MTDIPRFEIPQQMRALAENSVAQARTAFDSVMGVTKRGTEAMRGMGGPMAPGVDLYARGLDYAEQNVHAALDHAHQLSQAGTVQEILSLQTEFLRSQFLAMQGQAKELGGLAQGSIQRGVDQARGMADQARGATSGRS